MIFSVVTAAILITIPFLGSIFNKDYTLESTGIIQERTINQPTQSAVGQTIQDPLSLEKSFDLDHDGKAENITVFSTLGQEIGNEITIITINNSKNPGLQLGGYFHGMQVHTMNSRGQKILELNTIEGHSINTTFYMYKSGSLNVVPVSTAKPPSFYGIVSRNAPDVKDVDGDGALELLAYYYFPGDTKRAVEVYTFKNNMFQKSQEYEEAVPPA